MDEKKLKQTRQRLSTEYENLIKSINRNRMAAEEIKLENTEDEADRATISHNKELLYNLHESDFMRLRVIQEALNVLDRGQYGQCVRCGENINEKRLVAVPWATLCHCLPGRSREGRPLFTSGAGQAGRRRDGAAVIRTHCSESNTEEDSSAQGQGQDGNIGINTQ